MQSAYVSLDRGDGIGDEVVLLGDDLPLRDVAAAWGTGPQQAMVALVGMGRKSYGGMQNAE
jgi:alanine racemase